jgi:hypothetical protein
MRFIGLRPASILPQPYFRCRLPRLAPPLIISGITRTALINRYLINASCDHVPLVFSDCHHLYVPDPPHHDRMSRRNKPVRRRCACQSFPATPGIPQQLSFQVDSRLPIGRHRRNNMKKWLGHPVGSDAFDENAETEDLVPEAVIQQLNKWAQDDESCTPSGHGKPARSDSSEQQTSLVSHKEAHPTLSPRRTEWRHRKRGATSSREF